MISRLQRVACLLPLIALGACSKKGHDASAAPVQTVFPSPEAAAQHSLLTLKKLAAVDARAYGFTSATDVQRAVLAPPERVVVIPNDKLASLQPGSDVTPLLVDTHRLIFPVTVDNQGMTSITLQQDSDGWSLASFGQQALAHNLVSARAANARLNDSPGSDSFQLSIQSLTLDYLATSEKEPGGQTSLYLIPLDDPASGISSTGPSGSRDKTYEKSAKTAKDYSKIMYQRESLDDSSSGYAINLSALTVKRKTAADVLSGLAPAAKVVQKADGPR